MRCPNCKLENPKISQRCDCGYDFEKKEMKESYIKKKKLEQTKKTNDSDFFTKIFDFIFELISVLVFWKKSEKIKKWQYNIVSIITFIVIIILLVLVGGIAGIIEGYIRYGI